jgi:hypothetical protein
MLTLKNSRSQPDSSLVRDDGYVQVNNLVLPGNLSAAGGVENLRMLRGYIQSNGATRAGGGFSVNRTSTGLYDIHFELPFLSVPAASVTQVYSGSTSDERGGDTRDNAVIVRLATDRMRVKIGDSAGAASDRDFSFVVIGPR